MHTSLMSKRWIFIRNISVFFLIKIYLNCFDIYRFVNEIISLKFLSLFSIVLHCYTRYICILYRIINLLYCPWLLLPNIAILMSSRFISIYDVICAVYSCTEYSIAFCNNTILISRCNCFKIICYSFQI